MSRINGMALRSFYDYPNFVALQSLKSLNFKALSSGQIVKIRTQITYVPPTIRGFRVSAARKFKVERLQAQFCRGPGFLLEARCNGLCSLLYLDDTRFVLLLSFLYLKFFSRDFFLETVRFYSGFSPDRLLLSISAKFALPPL